MATFSTYFNNDCIIRLGTGVFTKREWRIRAITNPPPSTTIRLGFGVYKDESNWYIFAPQRSQTQSPSGTLYMCKNGVYTSTSVLSDTSHTYSGYDDIIARQHGVLLDMSVNCDTGSFKLESSLVLNRDRGSEYNWSYTRTSSSYLLTTAEGYSGFFPILMAYDQVNTNPDTSTYTYGDTQGNSDSIVSVHNWVENIEVYEYGLIIREAQFNNTVECFLDCKPYGVDINGQFNVSTDSDTNFVGSFPPPELLEIVSATVNKVSDVYSPNVSNRTETPIPGGGEFAYPVEYGEIYAVKWLVRNPITNTKAYANPSFTMELAIEHSGTSTEGPYTGLYNNHSSYQLLRSSYGSNGLPNHVNSYNTNLYHLPDTVGIVANVEGFGGVTWNRYVTYNAIDYVFYRYYHVIVVAKTTPYHVRETAGSVFPTRPTPTAQILPLDTIRCASFCRYNGIEYCAGAFDFGTEGDVWFYQYNITDLEQTILANNSQNAPTTEGVYLDNTGTFSPAVPLTKMVNVASALPTAGATGLCPILIMFPNGNGCIFTGWGIDVYYYVTSNGGDTWSVGTNPFPTISFYSEAMDGLWLQDPSENWYYVFWYNSTVYYCKDDLTVTSASLGVNHFTYSPYPPGCSDTLKTILVVRTSAILAKVEVTYNSFTEVNSYPINNYQSETARYKDRPDIRNGYNSLSVPEFDFGTAGNGTNGTVVIHDDQVHATVFWRELRFTSTNYTQSFVTTINVNTWTTVGEIRGLYNSSDQDIDIYVMLRPYKGDDRAVSCYNLRDYAAYNYVYRSGLLYVNFNAPGTNAHNFFDRNLHNWQKSLGTGNSPLFVEAYASDTGSVPKYRPMDPLAPGEEIELNFIVYCKTVPTSGTINYLKLVPDTLRSTFTDNSIYGSSYLSSTDKYRGYTQGYYPLDITKNGTTGYLTDDTNSFLTWGTQYRQIDAGYPKWTDATYLSAYGGINFGSFAWPYYSSGPVERGWYGEIDTIVPYADIWLSVIPDVGSPYVNANSVTVNWVRNGVNDDLNDYQPYAPPFAGDSYVDQYHQIFPVGDPTTVNSVQYVLYSSGGLSESGSKTPTSVKWFHRGVYGVSRTSTNSFAWDSDSVVLKVSGSFEHFKHGGVSTLSATGSVNTLTGVFGQISVDCVCTLTKADGSFFGNTITAQWSKLGKCTVNLVPTQNFLRKAEFNHGGVATLSSAVGSTLFITIDHFRIRADDGTESTATWLAPVDTMPTLLPDTTYRIRFAIKNNHPTEHRYLSPTWLEHGDPADKDSFIPSGFEYHKITSPKYEFYNKSTGNVSTQGLTNPDDIYYSWAKYVDSGVIVMGMFWLQDGFPNMRMGATRSIDQGLSWDKSIDLGDFDFDGEPFLRTCYVAKKPDTNEMKLGLTSAGSLIMVTGAEDSTGTFNNPVQDASFHWSARYVDSAANISVLFSEYTYVDPQTGDSRNFNVTAEGDSDGNSCYIVSSPICFYQDIEPDDRISVQVYAKYPYGSTTNYQTNIGCLRLIGTKLAQFAAGTSAQSSTSLGIFFTTVNPATGEKFQHSDFFNFSVGFITTPTSPYCSPGFSTSGSFSALNGVDTSCGCVGSLAFPTTQLDSGTKQYNWIGYGVFTVLGYSTDVMDSIGDIGYIDSSYIKLGSTNLDYARRAFACKTESDFPSTGPSVNLQTSPNLWLYTSGVWSYDRYNTEFKGGRVVLNGMPCHPIGKTFYSDTNPFHHRGYFNDYLNEPAYVDETGTGFSFITKALKNSSQMYLDPRTGDKGYGLFSTTQQISTGNFNSTDSFVSTDCAGICNGIDLAPNTTVEVEFSFRIKQSETNYTGEVCEPVIQDGDALQLRPYVCGWEPVVANKTQAIFYYVKPSTNFSCVCSTSFKGSVDGGKATLDIVCTLSALAAPTEGKVSALGETFLSAAAGVTYSVNTDWHSITKLYPSVTKYSNASASWAADSDTNLDSLCLVPASTLLDITGSDLTADGSIDVYAYAKLLTRAYTNIFGRLTKPAQIDLYCVGYATDIGHIGWKADVLAEGIDLNIQSCKPELTIVKDNPLKLVQNVPEITAKKCSNPVKISQKQLELDIFGMCKAS